MPIPEPREDEDRKKYLGRCMAFLVGEENMAKPQAAAICYNKWRKRGKK